MKRIKVLISDGKVFVPLLALLLFLPLFFHGPRLGLPYVKGGDEIHYLAVINSLLMDGDLDLRNNYDSARKGSWQIGRKFAGQAIDPHVVWNVEGHQVIWSQVYEDTAAWPKDPSGLWVPLQKSHPPADVSNLPEYSSHPVGIAFLLAPVLWWVRGTPLTESLALACSSIAMILAALIFRGILKRYTRDPFALNMAALLCFCGTPLWAYGRTLYMEPFLVLFVLGAFGFVLEKRSGFWAGIFLGLGALLKPNFLILFFPLAWFLLKEKRFKTAVWMCLGPFLATVTVLYWNNLMYGSPWIPAQPFLFGNPLKGMAGLLLSWNHGLLALAPVACIAGLFWKKFMTEQGREARLLGAGFIFYFLMMGSFACWWGGWCYGPRLIAPVIPLFMIPILYLPRIYPEKARGIKVIILIVCFLSIAFNWLGALDGYWDSHPITLLWGNRS